MHSFIKFAAVALSGAVLGGFVAAEAQSPASGFSKQSYNFSV